MCIFIQNANHISRFSIYSQFLSSLCIVLHSCKTPWPLLLDRLTITARNVYILQDLQKNIIWILRGFCFVFPLDIKHTFLKQHTTFHPYPGLFLHYLPCQFGVFFIPFVSYFSSKKNADLQPHKSSMLS